MKVAQELEKAYYLRYPERIRQLGERIDTLAETLGAVLPEHKDWLIQAVKDHLAGRPVQQRGEPAQQE
jgi:hypothetical protein